MNKQMNRFFIIDLLIIILAMTGLYLFKPEPLKEEQIALITLTEGLTARVHALKDHDNNRLTDYQYCLSLEDSLLSYDGIRFNHRAIQTYIDGLKLQKKALAHYEDNLDQFSDQWREGYLKRIDALTTLLRQRQIKLSDDVMAEAYVGALTDDLGLAIAGDVTLKWDEKTKYYGFERKLTNTTPVTLKNVNIRITIYQTDLYKKTVWRSDQDWPIHLYAPLSMRDNVPNETHLTLEILSFTCGSYHYKASRKHLNLA